MERNWNVFSKVYERKVEKKSSNNRRLHFSSLNQAIYFCVRCTLTRAGGERESETPTSTEFLHDQRPHNSEYASSWGSPVRLRSDMHLEMSKIICVNKIDLKCVRFCTLTHAFTQFIFVVVICCPAEPIL